MLNSISGENVTESEVLYWVQADENLLPIEELDRGNTKEKEETV
ncbi:hypothetical protein Trydic_g4865, partial [Trypoxylus dichotomus]